MRRIVLLKTALFALSSSLLSGCGGEWTKYAQYNERGTTLAPSYQCRQPMYHKGGVYAGDGCSYSSGWYCVMYTTISAPPYYPNNSGWSWGYWQTVTVINRPWF